MSFHRENCTWQSSTRLWNLGFFGADEGWDDGSDDYDPEWDVEYDYGRFDWVSAGHDTVQAATDSWNGANPGGSTIVEYTAQGASRCAELDAIAARWMRAHPNAARDKLSDSIPPRFGPYPTRS